VAIAHDAQTIATAYTSAGTQNTSHAAAAGARAACVIIDQNASAADQVSGVTYGGAAMTRLRFDTESTEAGAEYVYWLDGIAGGTQTVAMTTTSTANKQLTVYTMTVAAGKAVAVAGHNSGTSASAANPSWTITGLTSGSALMAYEGIHSGLTTMTSTPATGWTLVSSTDLGAEGRGFARQAVASSGTTLACGWAASTADDFVGSAVAFIEANPPEDSPQLEASGFGTFSGVGSGDTINSVTATVNQWQSSASFAAPTYQLWDGTSGQIGSDVTGTVSTSTSNTDSPSWTGVTYSQLATLRLRITAHSGSAASGATQSVDWVALTVNYTSSGGTPIALDEAGAGADALSLASSIALAGAGAGADALSLSAGVALTEAGAAADALAIAQPTALAEAGSGSDALGIAIPAALAEAGSGADQLILGVPQALAEAGAGSDALSLTQPTGLTAAGSGSDSLGVMPGLSEAGAGSDALSVTVASPVALSDAGTGSDALSLTQPTALAEAGSGADALALAQPTALAEAGHGADVLGIVIPVTLAEAGAGADALSVTAASPVALAEAGSGSDALAVQAGVAVPLAEAGSGSDALAVAQPTALAEAGSGTASLAIAQPAALAEAGSGTDALRLAQPAALAEAGTGADSLAVVAASPVALAEAGSGADALAVVVTSPVALAEAGSGSDALGISTGPGTIIITDADSCHAEDSGFAYVTGADGCTGSDGGEVIRISDSDRCTATDVSRTRWVRDTDACHASELSLSAHKSDSDGGRATDGGERIALASSDACTAAEATAPVGIWTGVPPFKTGPGGGWYEVVHSGRTVIRARHAGLDVLRFAKRLHEAREVRWVHDADHSDFSESENHVTGVTMVIEPALELGIEIALIRADS
jgi:hypothetical protein